MDRAELHELHYITHVDNIPSILRYGILSHQRANRHDPISVAMIEIQARRSTRVVPQGLPIHSYACLYLHARNPMLYKLLEMHENLTVFRISPEVLDVAGAIIADGNASSDYTRFYPSPDGLEGLSASLVMARDWRDENPYEYWHKKRSRCAELLVPNLVPPEMLVGAYMSCERSQSRVLELGYDMPSSINHDLFFNVGVNR